MKIIKAQYHLADGEPFLGIQIEGFEPLAVVDTEANKALRGRKWGAVFLGAAFEDLLPVLMRGGQSFQGYCDDPQVVALAERFIADCEAGKFQDGKILIGE